MTVCRLMSCTKAIPRGKARKLLKDNGRIVELKLTRSMTPDMARATINRSFPQLSDEWEYLDSSSDNTLSTASSQLPDGNTLCSKRGCIYIADKVCCMMNVVDVTTWPITLYLNHYPMICTYYVEWSHKD